METASTEGAWTPSRFDFIDWEKLEAAADAPDCYAFSKVVRGWLQAERDSARREALALVADALVLQLAWHRSNDEPLIPAHILSALSQEGVAALAAHLPKLGNDELRARVTDVAWIKGRACSHVDVRRAIDAYVAEAKRVLPSSDWSHCFSRLQRAVTLAASLGRANDDLTCTLGTVEAVVHELDGSDPLWLSARLMELLLEYNHGDSVKIGAIAQRTAEASAAAKDYDRAVIFLEIAVRWAQIDDTERALAIRRRIAEMLEQRAGEESDPMMACHVFTQAIGALRRIPGARADVDRLRVALQAKQREVTATFSKDEHKIDLSDCIADARARVCGKSATEALVGLCSLSLPAPLDDIRERVKDRSKGMLHVLLPSVLVSESGRVLHRHNGIQDEEGLEAEMLQDVAFHQQIVARGGILPAVEAVRLEHGLRAEDFLYLASRSPFVPTGREQTFARGLALGFYGDFPVAAHLLVPQFENAVRELLEKHGAITTTLSSAGLQNEKDLGQLLADQKAKEVFGEAQVFEFRALLTEKAGVNLRNELAHGLIRDWGLYYHQVYFWWVALRVMLTPLQGLLVKQGKRQEASS